MYKRCNCIAYVPNDVQEKTHKSLFLMILNLIQNEKFEENARFKRGGNCLQRLSSPLVKARAEDLLQLPPFGPPANCINDC